MGKRVKRKIIITTEILRHWKNVQLKLKTTMSQKTCKIQKCLKHRSYLVRFVANQNLCYS